MGDYKGLGWPRFLTREPEIPAGHLQCTRCGHIAKRGAFYARTNTVCRAYTACWARRRAA